MTNSSSIPRSWGLVSQDRACSLRHLVYIWTEPSQVNLYLSPRNGESPRDPRGNIKMLFPFLASTPTHTMNNTRKYIHSLGSATKRAILRTPYTPEDRTGRYPVIGNGNHILPPAGQINTMIVSSQVLLLCPKQRWEGTNKLGGEFICKKIYENWLNH